MAGPYGITLDGFNPKTAEIIKAEIESDQHANINPALNVSADSVFGQANAIFASKCAEIWEVLADSYASQDPDQAEGQALEAICALTGTERLGSEPTRVFVIVTLAGGVTLPIGSAARIQGDPNKRFLTLTEVFNPGGGNDVFEVEMEAENDGAIDVPLGSLEIADPVAGWLDIDSPFGPDVGRAIETTPELRVRRELEIDELGSANLGAIRAAVSRVSGVDEVAAYENTSSGVDDEGRPAHSIEIVVSGGVDGAIAQAIFDNIAGGIYSFGYDSDQGTAFDSEGNAHTIAFSRPTDRPVHINATLKYASATIDEEAVKLAVLAEGIKRRSGKDVVLSQVATWIINSGHGVWDVLDMEAGFNGVTFVPENLEIGVRERAQYLADNLDFTFEQESDE